DGALAGTTWITRSNDSPVNLPVHHIGGPGDDHRYHKQKAEEQQGRLNGFGKRLGGPLTVSCFWILHGLGLYWRHNKYPEVSDIQTREETILSGTDLKAISSGFNVGLHFRGETLVAALAGQQHV
ncbi:hypothetical protein DF186_14210, partial [Enterococcus hirae]